jgi:hypothetical protein
MYRAILAIAALCSACAPVGAPGSYAAYPAGEPPQVLQRQAAEACAGSGFPAIASIAAPGVSCDAVQGMTGGPPLHTPNVY